jgi:hypothetical protein
VGSRNAVVAYRDMIIAVRDQVAPMVRRGMTLEQVLAATPTASYNSRILAVVGSVGRLYYEGYLTVMVPIGYNSAYHIIQARGCVVLQARAT